MGMDYFDDKLLCKPGTLYYIGVRERAKPNDVFSPLVNNCNPIHYETLEKAAEAKDELSATRLDLETKIFQITVEEVKHSVQIKQ